MIRPYVKNDKADVLALIGKNTPAFFDPSEAVDFEHYLDHQIEDYFVYEKDATILGAGGINYEPQNKVAVISWDMVDPSFHGHGIGRQLTQHRIDTIRKKVAYDKIIVRTSQLTHKFYEKMGFGLVRVVKDFWAKGYDLYEMHIDYSSTTISSPRTKS